MRAHETGQPLEPYNRSKGYQAACEGVAVDNAGEGGPNGYVGDPVRYVHGSDGAVRDEAERREEDDDCDGADDEGV